MNSLKMKVVGFDIIKSTLQIKFASDLAEKPIDEYETHLFSVVQEDNAVTDEQILQALAQNGWNIALQQEIAEQTAKDNQKVDQYKSYVGKEFSYTAEELFAPQACQAAEEQPLSQGLMVI
jgi:hypothetical protein